MTDSIQTILAYADFYTEDFSEFENVELAFERFKNIVENKSVTYEKKKESFLRQISSGSTRAGIMNAIEPIVTVEQDLVVAKAIQQEQERSEAYERIFIDAEQIERQEIKQKQKMFARRMKSETEMILARQNRFLDLEREDILRLPQTRSNTLARFYGMDESEVETKLDEVSIEYDGSGRILKSVVAG